MVTFEGVTDTPCSIVRVAVYCFPDNKIYIDLVTVPQIFNQFDSFVRLASIIAHEYAHAYTGLNHLEDVFIHYGNSNSESRKVEQLADCLTGTFIRNNKQFFDDSDILQIGNFFFSSGSDADGTHGSGIMRRNAWTHGYDIGNCDDFI